jgi:nucleotide-binding universal stress UspA family protein
MSETLLVAVDGSNTAQNAAFAAMQIARAEKMKILGVYIVDTTLVLNPYATHRKELHQPVTAPSREQLIETAKSVGDVALYQLRDLCELEGIEVETQVLFGDIGPTLLHLLEGSTMLAMGRRGNGHDMEQGTLGSKFLHVAEHACVPLLAGGSRRVDIHRLYLSYTSGPDVESAIEWTERLQKGLPAEVVIGGDVPESGTERNAMLDRFERMGLAKYSFAADGEENPKPDLVTTLNQNKADLVLLQCYHYPRFIEWFMRSKTDQILRSSQIPVLMS